MGMDFPTTGKPAWAGSTVFEQVADGGISFAASTKVAYLDTSMKDYVIKSDPVGFIDTQSGAALSKIP